MLKSCIKENGFILGIIALLIIISYGLLSPWLGFYWDDWVFAWLSHFYGPVEFIQAFRPFRPLLGPIFMVTTALFGESTFGWQLIGLFVRFLLSSAFWWCLRQVWPTERWHVLWVVFLFTVFPGYGQQWVALTHVNQEMISFLCLIISFGLTAKAARTGGATLKLTLPALILQFFGLFTTEYFFGLEVVRFLFLAVIQYDLTKARGKALKSAVVSWMPYLALWMVNAAWTLVYHRSGDYNSYQFNLPSISLISISNEILNVIKLAGFSSWGQSLELVAQIDGTLTYWLTLLILVVTNAGLYLLLRRDNSFWHQTDGTGTTDRWGWQAVVIGLVAMLSGRLPSWIAGLPLKLEFDYDRLMISIILGASLFIIGLFSLVSQKGNRQLLLFSLLIGFSVSHQFTLSNTFRRDWQNERELFWQFIWRAPALEKNTVLMTYQLPLVYASDFQLTAPFNWIYAPNLDSHQIPYMILDIKSRLDTTGLPSLKPDQGIHQIYRTSHFEGSTSNSLVFMKTTDACLRILDSRYNPSETIPGLYYMLADAIPLSDLERIDANAPQAVPDPALFGTEPEHGWCYFYEKAELARQAANWGKVVDLYKAAIHDGLSARSPAENLPFIEAFANTSDWNQSTRLSLETLDSQAELCPAILSLWNRVSLTGDQQKKEAVKITETLRQNGCK